MGKLFALLNAVTWAAALILFKRSGEAVSPLALNLFKNTVGIALIAATLLLVPLVTAWPAALDQSAPAWLRDVLSREFLILVLSGILGIAIADTIFFYGLNLSGVGLIAIVDCTYTPFVMLFAAWLLDKPPTPVHLVGAGLIIAAVLLCTGHAPPTDRTRRQIVLGIALAVLAVGLMAFGIVIATPVLETSPALWTSLVRLVGGTAVLALVAPLLPGLGPVARVMRPSSIWTVAVPASFFGAYLAMVFWVAGFSMTSPSVAAALNQSSSVVALIFAAVFLRERLTPRKLTAIGLAMAGVLVMIFHQRVHAWLSV